MTTPWRTSVSHLASMICASVLLLIPALGAQAHAQTFQVIHDFSGGGDGASPRAGLAIDAAGNLYGTTFDGGLGYGTVFRLKHSPGGWVLTPLYMFKGGNDGANPVGPVIIAHDGTLYGTTTEGGGSVSCVFGCGTVFRLQPPPTRPSSVLSPWIETVVYRFSGLADGANPMGELTFDAVGNLYGTAKYGGTTGAGVIYKLTHSGNGWTQSVLYTAQNNGDGASPVGGVVLDVAENVYGVFQSGGPFGFGAVYKLSPSGSGWTEQNLYNFGPLGGQYPYGGLIIDGAGNLYGSTQSGSNNTSYAFELTPTPNGWTYTQLPNLGFGGPQDRLSMDAAGNLYGTAAGGGPAGVGSVFKLMQSSGIWTYTSLHDFCLSPSCNDGALPYSNIIFDHDGNLYGTTGAGGTSSACSGAGCGVAFEITP